MWGEGDEGKGERCEGGIGVLRERKGCEGERK